MCDSYVFRVERHGAFSLPVLWFQYCESLFLFNLRLLCWPFRLKVLYCLMERDPFFRTGFWFPFVPLVFSILLSGLLPPLPSFCIYLVFLPLHELEDASLRNCRLKYIPHFCRQCVFVRGIFVKINLSTSWWFSDLILSDPSHVLPVARPGPFICVNHSWVPRDDAKVHFCCRKNSLSYSQSYKILRKFSLCSLCPGSDSQ